MKRLGLLVLVATMGLSLGSCTKKLLIEAEGGHSPMMRLNGHWGCDEYVTTDDQGTQTEQEISDEVWFNSTKDQGGYCEGTWISADPVQPDEPFLWGFDDDGNFLIQHDTGDEVFEVLAQSKTQFEVERTDADGTVHKMAFSR